MAKPEVVPLKTALGPDPHSYANYNEVITTHIDLEWFVDFRARVLRGNCTHILKGVGERCGVVHFDTRGLTITNVTTNGAATSWKLSRQHEVLGTCLTVDLIPSVARDETIKVSIDYSTQANVEPSGFDWFTPEQTLGKQHPFMYTQFQAILARTALPCMDTPAVKAPYRAVVHVPAPLTAACSGQQEGEGVDVGDQKQYTFNQPVPIPSYLIALVVGDIQRYPVGERTGVWCEPGLSEAATKEFDEMESFVEMGEKLVGVPYKWGNYDIVMLPLAFAYGGMENPCLTFVNSALIVGDKSLVDVIAHEISHSWTGNLVTNSSWGDFWLNEGFTMYLERLIIGEHQGEDMRHFHGHLGYGEYLKAVEDLQDTPEWRKLQPSLLGEDPDDAFSRIPYEKGCLLLFYLEKVVGGREAMLGWLNRYITDFTNQSLSSKQMIEHFEEYFKGKLADPVPWEEWLHGDEAPFDSRTYLNDHLNTAVQDLVGKWTAGGEECKESDLEWSPTQTLVFLDHYLTTTPLPTPEILSKMDKIYKLSVSPNPEILQRWLLLGLKVGDSECMPKVDKFLSHYGRGIYVRQLYKQLVLNVKKGCADKAVVLELYTRNRVWYNTAVVVSLDKEVTAALA